jgi:hypothetical protein
MTAAILDFRPARVPGAVTPGAVPGATGATFRPAPPAPPVSRRRLVCRWHCDASGRLVRTWMRDSIPGPAASGCPNPSDIA